VNADIIGVCELDRIGGKCSKCAYDMINMMKVLGYKVLYF